MTLVLPAFAAPAHPAPDVVSGTLEIVVEDDFSSGHATRHHFLHEPSTGNTYRIRFAQEGIPELQSGSQVILRGTVHDDELIIGPDGLEVLSGAEPRGSAADQRRVLVMIVDFVDREVPCSDTMITDHMFTGASSVDGLYQESSFGAVSFPHDTDGNGSPDVIRVSISANTADACDQYAWADEADLAVQAAGVDLGLYQHRLYVLPNWANCSWAGSANVGCVGFCRAWVRFCGFEDVYAHELGHNLSMRHASTDDDNDGTIDCSYCDTSDFMGYGGVGWRQVNGPHKEQMGWLPPAQIVELSSTGTQDHVISPLETDPGLAAHPQLLKIFNSGRGDYYHISYRRPVGYDASLDAVYADKTNIQRYAGSGNTLHIATVGDGVDFVDNFAGITITQLSHDAQSATVRLSFSGCGAGSPDTDGDGTPDCNDGCPTDPGKTGPGVCGCGVSDVDSDGDGLPDCYDGCPADPNKTGPGDCGCGVPDADTDGDGTADCNDSCPADPAKIDPGVCGCGVADADADGDGTMDCQDVCPGDSANDVDGDGVCGDSDNCPAQSNPGQEDLDGDGAGDVCDACTDPDGDGFGNPGFPANTCAEDNCPGIANPTQADGDGDGVGDACDIEQCDGVDNDGDGQVDEGFDADSDGVADCVDNCSGLANPGQEDADGDGSGDACDDCPDDPDKISPGSCGCGTPDVDADGDGTPDCVGDDPLPPVQNLRRTDIG